MRRSFRHGANTIFDAMSIKQAAKAVNFFAESINDPVGNVILRFPIYAAGCGFHRCLAFCAAFWHCSFARSIRLNCSQIVTVQLNSSAWLCGGKRIEATIDSAFCQFGVVTICDFASVVIDVLLYLQQLRTVYLASGGNLIRFRNSKVIASSNRKILRLQYL